MIDPRAEVEAVIAIPPPFALGPGAWLSTIVLMRIVANRPAMPPPPAKIGPVTLFPETVQDVRVTLLPYMPPP